MSFSIWKELKLLGCLSDLWESNFLWRKTFSVSETSHPVWLALLPLYLLLFPPFMPMSFMFLVCLPSFIHVGSLFLCYICLSLLCIELKCTIMMKIQFHTIVDRDNSIFNMVSRFLSGLSPSPSVSWFSFSRPHVHCSSESVWYFAAVVNRSSSPSQIHSEDDPSISHVCSQGPPHLPSHLLLLTHLPFSLTRSWLVPFSLLSCVHPAPFSLWSHPSVNSAFPVFPLFSPCVTGY